MSSKINLFALLIAAALTFSVPPTVAQNATFEIVTESASGPPYPTENLVVNLLEVGETGGSEHTSTVHVSLGMVSDKATPKLLETATKGKVADQEFVQFDLLYDGDGTDLEPDTFFDVT